LRPSWLGPPANLEAYQRGLLNLLGLITFLFLLTRCDDCGPVTLVACFLPWVLGLVAVDLLHSHYAEADLVLEPVESQSEPLEFQEVEDECGDWAAA
jgi:hypothetical protein